jgi:cation diffusion facilitator family transporter
VSEVYRKVKKVLWIILFANLAVAAAKILIGMVTRSTGITSDGFHSLSDGSSNIVGLIGLRLASKPVDEDHPYGHTKFETLAGLFIAGMLFFMSVKIVFDAVDRFMNPVIPNITTQSLIALLATLCINVIICTYELKVGRKLGSQILISDAKHTRSDVYVSIGVLMALLAIKLGLPAIIDPITSVIVAGFILYAGYEIFKENGDVLVDKAPVDAQKIRVIALGFEQVKDIHDIRSRGNQADLHVDMHVMTDPEMSIEESHELIHSIENELRDKINSNIQLIAHLEPFDSDHAEPDA